MAPDGRGLAGAKPVAPVVAIKGLRKVLRRGVVAIDGLDLVVQAGQAMGLAGPNGAGKSMTLKALLGLVRPTSGTVELFGAPVRPGFAALSRVGVLVDGPGFVPYLSGRENLRLGLAAASRSLPAGALERALDSTALGAALDRPYRTYSHGMRYRLGLAQAMLGDPDLLILDEPTTGLDPAHVIEIERDIKASTASGTTVLLSSHVLPFIERVCSHVAIVNSGRVAAAGPIAALMGGHASLEEAYMALAPPG